ncbi:MAG: flagellar protein FliS [Pirellulales bacterium]|nr:flagellar protein FliS [Pirellulales bacterium]
MTQLAGASRYLDARIAAASQPELQLMLLDGALRFGRQAEQVWTQTDQQAQCARLLSRAIDLVEALIQGVAAGKTPISQRLEEEYAYAFRQLAAAQLNRDATALTSALELLAIERETWKLVVEKLRENPAVHTPAPHRPTPILRSLGGFPAAPQATLSLEG